jgi:potassium-dependent mechanosensitive channel
MNNLQQKIVHWTIFFVLFSISGAAFCFENNSIQSLVIADRQLAIDKETHAVVTKQFIDLKNSKNSQLHLLQNQGVTLSALKHAQLDFIAAQAAVEGNNIALMDAKEVLDDTDSTIRSLEKTLQESMLLTKNNQELEDKSILIEAQLEFLRRLQQLQFDRVKTLTEIKTVTQKRLTLEKNWQQKLQVMYASQQEQEQRNQLAEQLTRLQKQQQDWLGKLNNLTQNLQMLTMTGQVNDLSAKRIHSQILEAEEYVTLVKLKSYLVHLQDRLQNFQELNNLAKTTTQLSELSSQAGTILAQLDSSKDFMNDKVRFLTLKKKQLVFDYAKRMISGEELYTYSSMLVSLINSYQQTIADVAKIAQKTTSYQKEFKLQLQHHLSERHTFPSDLPGWISLGQKILQIPDLLGNALRNFINQTLAKLKTINGNFMTLFLFSIPFVLGGWLYLRRLLLNIEINIKEDKQRFSTNVVYILLELTRRNLGTTVMLALVAIATLWLKIASPLFVCLLLAYWIFKISLSIAQLTLLENVSDISGGDVKVYYRMRSSLILGWLLSTLVAIAHNLPVAYEVKIFINRLFMVFILLLAWQLFKVRKSVPILLSALMHINRRYFYRILQLLSVLIPLALVFNAIVGLLGYVELAWAVARYQAIFILVLAGYLTVRGLLIDALEYISELFIGYVKQGWLWTQAILKPVDRILQIILFLCAAIFLMRLYHLDNNEFFINSVRHLLYEKLFTLGGNEINALLLCQLLIIISMTKWLAHWSREFSYRWLYAKAKDVGLRNSLSIFTQYASVIVSVLIGLKVLGIDLRGFTVVAAAFAAGIGFGMRDLIINFFSGILLLIERPFRNGDIVSVGNYEGEVIQTGMRSMTVRTWDNMAVIVPNADMFTKPFVNWTHHDNIVRTVITLKINREDDPHYVQRLILDLLMKHESIAPHPIPEVIMFELSESLIEMQVRYYILLTPHRTRAGVRSEILFAIWDCFKQHNIRAPHPQYDLIVKNNHNSNLVSVTELA